MINLLRRSWARFDYFFKRSTRNQTVLSYGDDDNNNNTNISGSLQGNLIIKEPTQ